MGAGSNGIVFDDIEFQGHCIYTNRISQKRCILGTKLLKKTLIGNHTQSIEWYHLKWP